MMNKNFHIFNILLVILFIVFLSEDRWCIKLKTIFWAFIGVIIGKIILVLLKKGEFNLLDILITTIAVSIGIYFARLIKSKKENSKLGREFD